MSRANFDMILAAVSSLSGIDAKMICGSHHDPKIVFARSLVIAMAREYAGMSYPELAKSLTSYRPMARAVVAHTTPLTMDKTIRRRLAVAFDAVEQLIAETSKQQVGGAA